MSAPTRFWNTFYELVAHGYLLQAHCTRAADIDRRVKIFLAVTSTTSLGIWAVFKVFPSFWAAIIVITQIVSATAKYLPYSSRLKASAGCSHDYRDIQNWPKVNGAISWKGS